MAKRKIIENEYQLAAYVQHELSDFVKKHTKVQSVPGNHIGSEPNEQIAALEKQIATGLAEADELRRICEEKDAEIAKLRQMVHEIKPTEE